MSKPAISLSSRVLALLAGALLLPAASGAQSATHRPDLVVRPAQPAQGRLVELLLPIAAGETTPPAASFGGEPVHFERRGAQWWTLGAIAVEAPDSVPFVVRRGADSTVRWVAVRRGDFPMERLTVAPKYGSKPDSTLQARIDREVATAYEIGKRSHERPRLWLAPFVRPRPGRVTSGFGRGREYNGETQSRHMGTDFAGARGTPVRATNRGVVALVDTFYLGGRVVYVDHGAGLVSAYMHLSRADVQPGDTVQRGQVIGRVGATGRVTGPHLHWTVRYGTTTVDPLSLPGLSAASAAKAKRPTRKGRG